MIKKFEELNENNIDELRDEVRGAVFNMVNHEDDVELAEESVDEIMESIKKFFNI